MFCADNELGRAYAPESALVRAGWLAIRIRHVLYLTFVAHHPGTYARSTCSGACQRASSCPARAPRGPSVSGAGASAGGIDIDIRTEGETAEEGVHPGPERGVVCLGGHHTELATLWC